MLRPTVFMFGEAAGKLFYTERYIQRRGAAPLWLQKTLTGRGSIQNLDGEQHRRRKKMMLALCTGESVKHLTDTFAHFLQQASMAWELERHVKLYDQFREILARSVCHWAGVPLENEDVSERTNQLAALFERSASFGIGQIKARRARRASEAWLARLINEVRTHQLLVSSDCVLMRIATYREVDGTLLSAEEAAVELLNILRPTVAVAVYAVCCALGLVLSPTSRERMNAELGYLDLFVQEVRRFFPFFPGVMGMVRDDFQWRGYDFKKGWRVVFDLYGTNHDPRLWDDPDEFMPDRFRGQAPAPYGFVAQGGGDARETHRCAGEMMTLELMKTTVIFLTQHIAYEVPVQKMELNLHVCVTVVSLL